MTGTADEEKNGCEKMFPDFVSMSGNQETRQMDFASAYDSVVVDQEMQDFCARLSEQTKMLGLFPFSC